MNTLFKVASSEPMKSLSSYEIGGKRERKPHLIWKVAQKPSMGKIENRGVKQPKKILHPPNGNMPLKDSVGKPLKKTKKKPMENYRPMGDGRKMRKDKLVLDAGTGVPITSGRKMKPGQQRLSNGVGQKIRKMKSGKQKLTMSTGGLRKMKSGQPVQRHAEGGRV